MAIECTLLWGEMDISKPAMVKIEGVAATSGTQMIFSLDGIQNPLTSGQDTIHIHFKAISYSSSDIPLDGSISRYSFTVLENPAVSSTASSPPELIGTPWDASAVLKVTFDAEIDSDDTSIRMLRTDIPLNMGDSVVDQDEADIAGSEVHYATGWLLLPGTATAALITFSAGLLPYLPIGSAVTEYHVKNGVIVGIYQHISAAGGEAIAGGALSAALLYPSTPDMAFMGQFHWIRLDYTLNHPVPAQGCMLFTFLNSEIELDASVCSPSQSQSRANMGDWTCESPAPRQLRLFLGVLADSGTQISIMTRLAFQSGLGPVSFGSFYESACLLPIEKDDETPVSITGETESTISVTLLEPELPKRLALANELAEYWFDLTLKTTIPEGNENYMLFLPSEE
jgi:hypothetical protein